jgi:glycosyltransferase involved in cell wall biosynthesis
VTPEAVGSASALRVLHVVASLDEAMGGSVQAALGLAEERAGRGAPTEVVATAYPDDTVGYLGSDFPLVAWRTFPRSFPKARFNSRALTRWLRAEVPSFDVVHIHSTFHMAALHAARAAAAAGVPVVIHPHGSLDPFDLAKHAAFKRVYGPVVVRRLLDAAAAVVCTTQDEVDLLVTWGSRTPVRVVPLPVRPPPPADGAAFRAGHGIDRGAIVVLSLGRLDPKKGLDLLVPAAAEVRAEQPRLHLVVAGAGDHASEEEADRLLAGPVAEGWATRTGFLTGPAKAGAFAAADIFGLPSRRENFGITVVEAAAAGIALALSHEVAIAGVVEERGAGAVGDATAAGAASTLRALLDPETRHQAGEAARRMASEQFSPAAAGAAMEAVYDEVVADATMGR